MSRAARRMRPLHHSGFVKVNTLSADNLLFQPPRLNHTLHTYNLSATTPALQDQPRQLGPRENIIEAAPAITTLKLASTKKH